LIEASNGVGNNVMDHDPGKSFERQAMDAGAKALFDGANGPFNLTNV
jgi:hypothetical protein